MKGILMTTANHLATREKRKTQTRRLDGLKEINQEPDRYYLGTTESKILFLFRDRQGNRAIYVKPRYQVGEVVYLKEKWAIKHDSQSFSPKLDDIVRVVFGDGEMQKRYGDICYNADGTRWLLSVSKAYDTGEWQSPMFLPELCARAFITITKVGIGRLQDITWQDCRKEGITAEPYEDYKVEGIVKFWQGRFANLWNSINGKTYPWELNPWCWEISYELLEIDTPTPKGVGFSEMNLSNADDS